MNRPPQTSTRTGTLFPYTTLFRAMPHSVAVQIPGSNNPTGVEVKGPQYTLPFHPYYTAKDGFGLGVFLIALALIVFFAPNFLGHADNYIKAKIGRASCRERVCQYV